YAVADATRDAILARRVAAPRPRPRARRTARARSAHRGLPARLQRIRDPGGLAPRARAESLRGVAQRAGRRAALLRPVGLRADRLSRARPRAARAVSPGPAPRSRARLRAPAAVHARGAAPARPRLPAERDERSYV